MEKSNIIKVVKFVLKFVLPIIVAWLEGDTHTLQTFVSVLVSSI